MNALIMHHEEFINVSHFAIGIINRYREPTLKNGCFLTSSASFSPAPRRLSGFLLNSWGRVELVTKIKQAFIYIVLHKMVNNSPVNTTEFSVYVELFYI